MTDSFELRLDQAVAAERLPSVVRGVLLALRPSLSLLTIDVRVAMPGAEQDSAATEALTWLRQQAPEARWSDLELDLDEVAVQMFASWSPWSIHAVAWRTPYGAEVLDSVDGADPMYLTCTGEEWERVRKAVPDLAAAVRRTG